MNFFSFFPLCPSCVIVCKCVCVSFWSREASLALTGSQSKPKCRRLNISARGRGDEKILSSATDSLSSTCSSFVLSRRNSLSRSCIDANWIQPTCTHFDSCFVLLFPFLSIGNVIPPNVQILASQKKKNVTTAEEDFWALLIIWLQAISLIGLQESSAVLVNVVGATTHLSS